MARLILLDRDGVINFDSAEYIKAPREWVPIPGALDAIARLKRAGWLVGVCTNQAGVGRGILTEPALDRIHEKLHRALGARGVQLDGLVYCPHHPDDGCNCRKPRPGMLIDMMRRCKSMPQETLYVGDAITDVEAAMAAGCQAALVRTGSGAAVESEARGLGVTCIEDDLAALARVLTGDPPC